MKIITKPTVYLIGATVTSPDGINEFLQDHEVPGWKTDAPSSGDRIAEIGGRVCYMSFEKPRPGGNRAYIQHVKEVGHGSVLEHAVYTVIAVGISRAVSHEWVRHRAGMSPSQLSQRYVSESRGEFVIPPELAGDPDTASIWEESVRLSWDAYKRLVSKVSSRLSRNPEYQCPECRGFGRYMEDGRDIECARCDRTGINPERKTDLRKAARGAARSVLPNATETKIQMTGNARAWRHFFELRANWAADIEIRVLAVAVWRKLVALSPNLFGDYTVSQLPDGSEALDTPFRKV